MLLFLKFNPKIHRVPFDKNIDCKLNSNISYPSSMWMGGENVVHIYHMSDV